MKTKKFLSLVVALASLFLASVAGATTFTVTKTADTNDGFCNSDCSLREAITAANNTAGDDIITLPSGIYTIQQTSTCEDNNNDGDFDVNPAGGTQSLTINGVGIGITIIDGGKLDRVFHIVNPPPPPPSLVVGPRAAVAANSLILNNLTVRNGSAHELTSGCSATGDGGGIFAQAGSLILNSVEVKDNVANLGEGGGIANQNVVTIDKSLITGNHSDSNGGGIYSGTCPSLAVTNTAISGNSTATSGGGVYSDCSLATITNSTISTNTADENGGGVADTGSGIMRLRNVTVTKNVADNQGNNSGGGGGVAAFGSSTAQIIVRNTIIAGNDDLPGDTTPHPDCFFSASLGLISSEEYNLIGDNTGCSITPAIGDQIGTGGVGTINALLGPLADNGGATLTHALLTGSPAIDNANPAGCFSNDTNNGNPLITDQRGSPRPLDGGPTGPSPAQCDIGAFELGGCGDGFKDSTEQCDDGNIVSGDGCSATCQIEACGNGTVDVGEVCDDGNTTNGDGCSSTCQLESCGDGVVQPSEQCDDGNTTDGDGCDSNCTPTGCGNRILTSGEACDDGNTVDADGCESDCTLPVCGNSIVDPGEECDDGNATDGDGCSATCLNEPATALLLGDGGCSLSPSSDSLSQGFTGLTGVGLLASAGALLIRKRISR